MSQGIIEPSTTVRTHTELCKLGKVQKKVSQTVAILLTDGGPEHNITFKSVQIAIILCWKSLGLDQFIVGRSCPQNSWTNEIERIMAVLNLALYSMCFTRLPMRPITIGNSTSSASSSSATTSSADIETAEESVQQDEETSSSAYLEQRWRSSKSISQLRERLDEDPEFLNAASASVKTVCNELKGRFLQQMWGDNYIQPGALVDKLEMKEFVSLLCTFDPALSETLFYIHLIIIRFDPI